MSCTHRYLSAPTAYYSSSFMTAPQKTAVPTSPQSPEDGQAAPDLQQP